MSYILDALKKSELERGNGAIPSVQTIHSSALNYHQQRRLLWPWILIAVLLVNVFILIYFLQTGPDIESVSTSGRAAENSRGSSASQNRAPAENPPAPAPITQAPPTPALSAPASPAPAKVTPTAPSSTFEPLLDIDELPAEIRRQIPSMVFSAHVYSSNPVQRSLVINNRFMEEGDAFSHDLILSEITRSGAVFTFRGHRFHSSVLSGWNSQ
ncbi:MAG: general secretion pathway protein GspB [Gammaproteobacteria bacterium]|nr:general secretion pathway protein GspB [Gammaproteobacteria bacterium]